MIHVIWEKVRSSLLQTNFLPLVTLPLAPTSPTVRRMVQGNLAPARVYPDGETGRVNLISTCNSLIRRFSSAVEQRFCNSLVYVRSSSVSYQ